LLSSIIHNPNQGNLMDIIATILVAILVLWIVLNLLQSSAGATRQKPGTAPPQSRDTKAGVAPATKLDEFLRAAQQRRKEIEQERARHNRPVQQEPVLPPPLPRDIRVPPRTLPPPLPPPLPNVAPAQPLVVPPFTLSGTQEEPPQTQWLYNEAMSQPETPPPDLRAPAATESELVPFRPYHLPQSRLGMPPEFRPSLVTAEVLRMLREPNSLRAALILREVLDRPVCQRGGQRR
jgi:hypothetical protein